MKKITLRLIFFKFDHQGQFMVNFMSNFRTFLQGRKNCIHINSRMPNSVIFLISEKIVFECKIE